MGLDADASLKPFPTGFPFELKVGGELYDNISYLLKLGGVCQGVLSLLYLRSQFLRKIGLFENLEIGKESLGFDWALI